MFRLATQRPIAVLMIAVAAALFGFLSYGHPGMELMPDLAYPTLTVRTAYPGGAPEEIEAEVTAEVESRVGTVEGLVGMTSSSRAGVSEVVLEFDWETDMDRASQRVRERLGRLVLPDVAERPLLLRYDPTLDPVMTVALSGAAELTALRRQADEELAPELSKIEGVAAVRVLGGLEREIQVRVNETALAGRGLSVSDVVGRLAAANVNLAGGKLKEGSVEFLVRTLAELRTPEEIGAVVVREVDGVLVRVEDVATVLATTREREVIARVAGEDAVRVDIFREADANIVEVCDRVRAAIFGTESQQKFAEAEAKGPRAGTRADEGEAGPEGARKARERAAVDEARRRRAMTDYIAHRLPDGMSLAVLGDQSRFIRAALDEVRGAAGIGGLLAVLILYLFLRSGWSTLVVAVAIPLSVLFTFVPMMLFGVTLNIMSLGGLALGVGMLVDNSVVVLESIFRCREEGDDIEAAAVRGSSEVGGAVIASTLTTVAVFFPIAFVKGVAGQVFGDLALAVVFSLLASLVVALFVVPMMAARQLRTAADAGTAPLRWSVPLTALPWWWGLRRRGVSGWLVMPAVLPYGLLKAAFEIIGSLAVLALALLGGAGALIGRALATLMRWALFPLAAGTSALLGGLRRVYPPFLGRALRRPFPVLLVVAALAAGAWGAARELGAELIPDVRQGVLQAELSFPVGTPLTETADRSAGLERALAALPHVERVEAFLGAAAGQDDDDAGRGPHSARLTLRLEATSTLAEQERGVIAMVRRLAADVPGLELDLSRPALFTLRPPIEVVVLGHQLALLEEVTARLTALLEGQPGLTDVQPSVRPGYPEIEIDYDRARLARLGLDARTVAEQLRVRLEGDVATDVRDRETRIDVRVRTAPEALATREQLAALVVNPGAPVPVPLDAVATLVPGRGPAEIRHVEGQRAAVITARTDRFDLGTMAERVRGSLQAVPMPPGFELRLRGQDQEMQASLESLRYALLLAIFLVYVVMASQFESLRAPLVVMGSLPLAAIGVFLVLGLAGEPLSVVVFIGLITLAGIVVNNAIVLVDYAGRLRGRGLDMDAALVEAGAARLRPILMTTLTTVLGLLPLALGTGEGAELRRPIALTLIAGLIFSTGLTLVIIPVLYRWIARGAAPSA